MQVWISRPSQRAGGLARALAAYGVKPLLRPALVLQAPPTNDDSLHRYLQAAATFSVAVFVSAAAAERVAAEPPNAAPKGGLPALAVGAATADALPPCYRLLAPPPPIGDSTALLQSPPLARLMQTAAAVKIAVLGGNGGDGGSPSPPLCAALAARGAKVTPVVCYQRTAAAADGELAAAGANGNIAATVAYSSDTLRFMLAMVAPNNDWLRQTPLFVIHDHIADAARQAGFTKIIMVKGDDATMAAQIAETIAPPPSAARLC